jgi:hypothetical protein
VTYDGFLDVGFTRNFASSQAYKEKFGNNPNVIPAKADQGLQFQKLTSPQFKDVYRWLGFEAHDLLFGSSTRRSRTLDVTIDVFAYDLNEPDILARLEQFGHRLRAITTNSTPDHSPPTSPESQSAKRLQASAWHRPRPPNPLREPAAQQGLHREAEGQGGARALRLDELQLPRALHQANNVLRLPGPRCRGPVRPALSSSPSTTPPPTRRRRWHRSGSSSRSRTSPD